MQWMVALPVTGIKRLTVNYPENLLYVVSYYLCRDIIPAVIQALKPGGLVYYQTFIRQRVSDRGPKRMESRLADQELLHLFSGLQVLFYREEGCVGNVQKGIRDEAMLVGRKKGASGHTSGTNGF